MLQVIPLMLVDQDVILNQHPSHHSQPSGFLTPCLTPMPSVQRGPGSQGKPMKTFRDSHTAGYWSHGGFCRVAGAGEGSYERKLDNGKAQDLALPPALRSSQELMKS
jgi:hypothetical protein